MGITGNNATEHKCYEHAYLIVKNKSGETKKKFRFETLATETYEESDSLMNMEYTKRSKTIFSPFYWLPFVKGARVQFQNGEILTIRDLVIINESKRALDNGHGTIGIQIMF